MGQDRVLSFECRERSFSTHKTPAPLYASHLSEPVASQDQVHKVLLILPFHFIQAFDYKL